MTDAVVAHGAESIRVGSKSFAAAAMLFDRTTRESAVMLYAWCRHCDDVVDGQSFGFAGPVAPEGSPGDRLAELERRTRSVLAGEAAADPAFAGLRAVVRRHGIPSDLPLQHLAGFGMDVEGRTYETIDELLDYAYGVAGVVGVMMAQVMGVRDPAILDRASDLGLAFQLTNIARDIIDDARAGRVYLPRTWLAEAGIPPDEVGRPEHRPALAAVARRLLAVADEYYASASVGIAALPPRPAWAIATALRVYRQIGTEVARRGEKAWDRRVSTSKAAKLRHVAASGVGILFRAPRSSADARERDGLYARPV